MIRKLFKKTLGQDEKLIKNIEEYDKKKKAEQQKSKVSGQKPVNREENKAKEINV
tara:strand:- start:649 stop:813 length:165 start_codon:yes stop_codon:yes gene_type:complete